MQRFAAYRSRGDQLDGPMDDFERATLRKVLSLHWIEQDNPGLKADDLRTFRAPSNLSVASAGLRDSFYGRQVLMSFLMW